MEPENSVDDVGIKAAYLSSNCSKEAELIQSRLESFYFHTNLSLSIWNKRLLSSEKIVLSKFLSSS
jgi:hypothetical protein